MRLTCGQVDRVHDAVKEATGTSWVQIGGHPEGGSKYVLVKEPQEVVYGGRGAAQALSYLAGVAAAYKVEEWEPKAAEVLSYLYESGRHSMNFDDSGKYRAYKVMRAK